MTTLALTRTPSLRDFAALTKPRLSSLVLATTAGGMWLAPGELSLRTWVGTLLATAGTVGAANAFNCYLERDSDRFMARTCNRPLPSGRMEPAAALGFAFLLAGLSIPALALFANALTCLLGFIALVSYVLVYTPLKARSPQAMLAGAIPGAIPPLMGWTAVTGHLEWPGVILFGILFFWQMPHFIAIALFRKDEYAAAGLRVPVEKDESGTRFQMVLYCLALLAVSLCLYPLHAAGIFYLVCAAAFGGVYLGFSVWGWWKQLGRGWARQHFLLSLLYMAGLFVALMVDGVARP